MFRQYFMFFMSFLLSAQCLIILETPKSLLVLPGSIVGYEYYEYQGFLFNATKVELNKLWPCVHEQIAF